MTAPDPRNLTHVTEFGLGLCARIDMRSLRERGLRPDTRACGDIGQPFDGSGGSARYIGVDQCGDTILTLHTQNRVPTCPRCAVLRDMALSGVLPERAT
jgi:hypothetical protein